MKSKAVYVLVVLSAVMAMVTSLYRCSGVLSTSEASGLPENFNALSRQDQVLICASCHPTQYENEMAGPHANAHAKLTEHVHHVNDSNYHLPFYADFVNMVQGQTCVSCHATDNLYEHYFKPEHTVDNLIGLYNDGNTLLPKVRASSESYSTGVDCLTCHYDGKKVVTNGHFKANETIAPELSCMPIGSTIFQSDFNCMPCHSPNMTEDHTFYYPGTASSTTCISCHQEYDAKGKGTHYYYWRFDPADRVRSERLTRFYEPQSTERRGDQVLVHWSNRNLPHRISDCPELVLAFAVVDSTGNNYGNGELRVNRKQHHDAVMANAGVFKGNALPGVSGISPLFNGSDTIISITLSRNPGKAPLMLEVTALSKPHYWEGDAIGVRKFSKRMPIK